MLVGPKEDVKALRPEPGIASGAVAACCWMMGEVAVGVTGAELIGLVVVGILTDNIVSNEKLGRIEEGGNTR